MLKTRLTRHDLRIDSTLYDLLRSEAEREHRSINGQIAFILEQHVESVSQRKRVVRLDRAGLNAREATRKALGGD